MSISEIGLDSKLPSVSVITFVSNSSSIIRWANIFPWREAFEIVSGDLKKTEKGFWWLGRSLNVRVHLGIFVLQHLLKQTDRGIEHLVGSTPLYMVFCGKEIIPNWRCPDHTKIEEFRNRLSIETKKKLGDLVLKLAVQEKMGDPRWMDVDSTVQEANMAYPADSNLLRKLALKVNKVIKFIREKTKIRLSKNISIDINGICKKAKSYFFLSKKTDPQKKHAVFHKYFYYTKHQLKGAIKFIEGLKSSKTTDLPWNIKLTLNFLKAESWKYLLDVAHFARTHSIRPGKRLCFHLSAVTCISKGKVDKKHEFGRQVQIGRIGGNFLIPLSTEVKMEDKKSLVPMVKNHIQIFGQGSLKEVGTDKGYFSNKQIKIISAMGINTDGVQRPGSIKKKPPELITAPLRDRRAGIEPLIGHLKTFGLKKSKMKSDASTYASVYTSAMGFNIHQMIRNLRTE